MNEYMKKCLRTFFEAALAYLVTLIPEFVSGSYELSKAVILAVAAGAVATGICAWLNAAEAGD